MKQLELYDPTTKELLIKLNYYLSLKFTSVCLEDRFKAKVLKEEIIKTLQDIID